MTSSSLKIGERFPPLILQDLRGQAVDLQALCHVPTVFILLRHLA